MDNTDKRILAALQDNADRTNQDLADAVNLSPAPCLRRVRALEESGVLLGRRAVLNRKALGLNLLALVEIGLDKHTPDRFDLFEREIGLVPEVVECLMVTGENSDYLLRIVALDMDDYRRVLLDRVVKIKGVVDVKSSFVLKETLPLRGLPLR